jgi:predicted signal transduction protein with EAL and GGDEF domain
MQATLQAQKEMQAGLADLRQQMQRELEESRDMLTGALRLAEERLQAEQTKQARMIEARIKSALEHQQRIGSAEQQIADLDKRLQAEQEARAALTEQVKRLVPPATLTPEATAPEQPQERKKPARKPKQPPTT